MHTFYFGITVAVTREFTSKLPNLKVWIESSRQVHPIDNVWVTGEEGSFSCIFIFLFGEQTWRRKGLEVLLLPRSKSLGTWFSWFLWRRNIELNTNGSRNLRASVLLLTTAGSQSEMRTVDFAVKLSSTAEHNASIMCSYITLLEKQQQ